MKKKVLSIIFAAALVLSLAACGSNTSKSDAAPAPAAAASAASATASATAAPTATPTAAPTPTATPSPTATPEPTPAPPKEMDGFDEATNTTLEIGGIRFSIPSYYIKNEEYSKDKTALYGTTGNDVVFILTYSDTASVPEEDFTSNNKKYLIQTLSSYSLQTVALNNTKDCSIGSFKGITANYNCVNSNNVPCNGKAAFVYDPDLQTLILVYLLQPDSSANSYLNDYDKIIESAVQIETAAPPEEPSGEPENNDTSSGEVTPEFKEQMDSYEAFFDEYVDFMNRYAANPTDMSLLMEYTEILSRYTEAMNALQSIEIDKLSPADYAYYIEVNGRITQKLAGVVGAF